MRLNEALSKLVPTKADGFITRPSGPTVRNARGPGEQQLHRYVRHGDHVEGFDASKDDLASDEWVLGSFAVLAAVAKDAKDEADAKAKEKNDQGIAALAREQVRAEQAKAKQPEKT